MLRAPGGSRVQVALAVAHDAGLGGDVEVHLAARARDELGRAAADVDHQQRRRVAAVARGGRAEVGQPRLLVAARACARRARSGRAPWPRTRRRWPRRGPPRSARRRAARSRGARSTPRSRRACRAPARCGASPSRPDASTPSPRRVTTERRSSSSHAVRAPRRRRAGASSWCRRRRPRRARVRPGTASARPASAASRFSTAISAIRSRVRTVAEPTCGTTSRFGASSSGSSAGSGSGSVTSSAAPAISPREQREPQRGLVDDAAARGVDEVRGRLHPRAAPRCRSGAASPA